MTEVFIDNIFAMFGTLVFQQTLGIPMDTKCAPLLSDLFPYCYLYFKRATQEKRKDASPILEFLALLYR